MSAPSGIKVPADITDAFSTALSAGDTTRALVFVIQGESFSLHDTIAAKGSYKDDMSLLAKALPNNKTPASFAYRLDDKVGGKFEWMMITFVPDDAGVCLLFPLTLFPSLSSLLSPLGRVEVSTCSPPPSGIT